MRVAVVAAAAGIDEIAAKSNEQSVLAAQPQLHRVDPIAHRDAGSERLARRCSRRLLFRRIVRQGCGRSETQTRRRDSKRSHDSRVHLGLLASRRGKRALHATLARARSLADDSDIVRRGFSYGREAVACTPSVAGPPALPAEVKKWPSESLDDRRCISPLS